MLMVVGAFLVGIVIALAAVASFRRPVCARAGAQVHDAPAAGGDGRRLRVGCYNIHRGKGLDGRKQLSRIARVIGDADVVGLCEVEGPFYGLRASQPRRLGRQLGLGWLFSPTQSRWWRHDRGNGLLSRYPVGRWYHEPLVDSTGRRGRILTTTEVQVGGFPVTVMVTHLSRRIDQQVQMATILERFERHQHAVLVGDFNVSRSFTELRAFLAAGRGIDAIGRVLGDADDPTRIDWILVRGLEVTDAGFEPAGASDHPYYWVDLALPAASQRLRPARPALRTLPAEHRLAARSRLSGAALSGAVGREARGTP